MPNVLLHIHNDLPGIGQLLRDGPELNRKVARKVYWLGLAAFFSPKAVAGPPHLGP
jgi:hypothetical protein